ncbi:unnamed protein product [Arctogadus glacialis]
MGPGSEVGLLQSVGEPVERPTVMDEAQRSAGPDSFWEGAGVVSSPDKVISGAPPAPVRPPPSPKPAASFLQTFTETSCPTCAKEPCPSQENVFNLPSLSGTMSDCG